MELRWDPDQTERMRAKVKGRYPWSSHSTLKCWNLLFLLGIPRGTGPEVTGRKRDHDLARICGRANRQYGILWSRFKRTHLVSQEREMWRVEGLVEIPHRPVTSTLSSRVADQMLTLRCSHLNKTQLQLVKAERLYLEDWVVGSDMRFQPIREWSFFLKATCWKGDMWTYRMPYWPW